MPLPKLSLARTAARIGFHPKSVLIHSRGPELVSRFYPDPFPDWGHGSKGNQLSNKEARLRAVVMGDMLELLAEPPSGFADLQALSDRLIFDYAETVGESASPSLLRLHQVFLTEHSSFDELVETFRNNTLRHERSWVRIGDYSIRDLGFTEIHYGVEEDGLDLAIGVFTPKQVADFFRTIDAFDFDPEQLPLDAADGALMVDLRRYRTIDEPPSSFSEIFAQWASQLQDIAQTLMERTLRGV